MKKKGRGKLGGGASEGAAEDRREAGGASEAVRVAVRCGRRRVIEGAFRGESSQSRHKRRKARPTSARLRKFYEGGFNPS